MLEARRVGVEALLFPGLRRIGPRPEQPDAAAEARSDQLALSVAVDVARREEAAEPIVERRDDGSAGRLGRRLVAPHFDRLRDPHVRILAFRHGLDADVELVASVAVDVPDQDLLGVALAEVGDDASALVSLRNVADDLSGLWGPVELVGLARRRVDLEDAVAIEVAELDLVNEGVRLAIELADVEAPIGLRRHERDDSLIVRRHRDRGRSVAEDVSDLGVAHAVLLAAEFGLPDRLRDERTVP